MALRPRAVITTPYPSPAATARVLGVSAKRYRELRAMVTEYLERHATDRTPGRSRKAPLRKRSTQGPNRRAAPRSALKPTDR